MKLNPYLNFDGQCRAAFQHYEKVLGGKIAFIMTWGEMPNPDPPLPPETKDLIMHVTMTVGDQTLQGADSPPGRYQAPHGIVVALHYKDKAEGEKVFKALADGGKTTMDFQETFWADGFGMCVDKFGIPWMVNCEKER